MFQSYLTVAKNAIAKYNLTQDEIESIYRYQELDYREQDVMSHADDLYENGIITLFQKQLVCNEATFLAQRFITKYSDCNAPENDVFESMILDFIQDNLNSLRGVNNHEADF